MCTALDGTVKYVDYYEDVRYSFIYDPAYMRAPYLRIVRASVLKEAFPILLETVFSGNDGYIPAP